MAGSPKPVLKRMAISQINKKKLAKGTDLNGREPFVTDGVGG